MKKTRFIFLFLFIVSSLSAQDTLNTPVSIGNISFDYLKPQEYDIGPIRVVGADNYDHQAIKLIALWLFRLDRNSANSQPFMHSPGFL